MLADGVIESKKGKNYEQRNGEMMNETVTVSFQIMFCSLPGATDKNYEKFQEE
jgi:hypothetical protein